MAVCEVYSQTITFKFKSTLCSKSTIFSVTTTFLSFVLPLLVAYRSHGFWLKNSEYREQPEVHFKHNYLLHIDTDLPSQSILCSNFPLAQEFHHCSVVKSREEDKNQDGKFDELIFEVKLNVPENVEVYSIKLLLFFDYVLQKQCLLQMEGLGLIQYSSGVPGRRFDYVGDLRLVQKQLLTTRDKHIWYNSSTFSDNEESTLDLDLYKIIINYGKRNMSTKLENSYKVWMTGVQSDEFFTIKVNINYPEENVKYRPSFWQVLKWAWIQYFSLLFICFNVFQRIKCYVFHNHLIPTMKEIPWSKKFE